MSHIDDYREHGIGMEGLPLSVYQGVPVVHQRSVREVDPELRVIWNPKIAAFAVVRRAPAVKTMWHAGEWLDGWSIVMGEWRDDPALIPAQLAGMIRLAEYRSKAEAVAEFDRRKAKADQRIREASDEDLANFLASEYPHTLAEAEALHRDALRVDAQWSDHSRAKLVIPARGGRGIRVFVDPFGGKV